MKSSRGLLSAFFIACFVVIGGRSAPCAAQGARATLTGTVVNPLGAPQGNVTLVVTNAAGIDRRFVTEPNGVFTFGGLPPGTYRLRVDDDTFAPWSDDAVTLAAGERKTIQIALQPRVVANARAAIAGTVFGPDGRTRGAVTVTLTDPAGADRRIVSETTGAYAFAELLPGTYRIRVENQPGAQPLAIDGLAIAAGERRLVDLRFQPVPAPPPPPTPTRTTPPPPPQTAAIPPAQTRTIEAPVVQFASGGIGLDEAINLTLQHDPNLKRQDATVDYREGQVQEARGPFDMTLVGSVKTNHRTQELTQSRKDSEADKRNKLDQQIADNKTTVQNANVLIPLIDSIKNSAPGQEGAALAQIRTIDPSMADLITLFDNLIATTSDPAQKASLVQSRLDFLQKSLGGDFETGLKDTISTQNDTILARQNLGDAPLDENFWDTTISLSISKLFRSGIQIAPYIDANDTGSNFRGKPPDSEHGGKGFNDLYTFHGGINLTFPLMRYRGAEAIAANENASIIERDASKLQSQHQMSSSAVSTVLAYWDVRAAMDTVEIARRTAELQANLLSLTRQLINAGELPGAELSRAQASDARARAQVEDANRQLHQARVALALAMGVSTTGDDSTLPLAKDSFPPTPDATSVRSAMALVGAAPAARLDLQAAQKQQDSGHLLEVAAETNLRPRLDLTASAWFTALDENNFQRAVGRWVGPSTEVGLNLEKPIGNNLYRGQLTQRQADVRQRAIAAMDLQRQIRLNVVQAAASLPEAVAQVQQAEAAVGFYKNIYDADVERFRTGEGTLIDTVITQQAQTEAALALTSARSALAHLIAQLRYQTGTLVGPNGQVSPQNYMTIPGASR